MIRFTKKDKSPEQAPAVNEENRFERIREDAAKARKKPAGGQQRGDKAAESDDQLL
jgi:hypothetical protein